MTGTAHASIAPANKDWSLGPVIDPDQQYAEFKASVRPDGSWSGAPDPGAKAKSPTTTLDTHPKFTKEQLEEMAARDRKARANAPSDDQDHATVVSVRTTLEGTSVRTYLPAPGVTPDELAASLRKTGHTDVRVMRPAATGTADVQPMAPNDCAYGSARTFRCPVTYWTNNGFEDPLVRFNDHSSAAWPATSAVSKWHQVPNIDSWYYWNSCPFMAGARCVDVLSGNYGQNGWTGYADMHWPNPANQSGPFAEQGNRVHLNDWYDPATYGFTRNHVVTHELGHVLGLGHNVWSGDLMYFQSHTREDIGGENPVLLAGLYSIPR